MTEGATVKTINPQLRRGHAAPYIRARMCTLAFDAERARTKRDRAKHIHMLLGLADALDILMSSNDTFKHVEPGIANEGSLPLGAIVLARHFLGPLAADKLFGPEARDQCEQKIEEQTTGRCLWWADDGTKYCRRHQLHAEVVTAPEVPT